jgi:hypothetical protein
MPFNLNYMKGKIFKLVVLLLLAFCNELSAQNTVTINGPAHVRKGQIYDYEIDLLFPPPPGATFTIDVSEGTIVERTTHPWTGYPFLRIQWANFDAEGYIDVSVSGCCAHRKTIYVSDALTPGQLSASYLITMLTIRYPTFKALRQQAACGEHLCIPGNILLMAPTGTM